MAISHPEYDRSKYVVWSYPEWGMVHWRLNPGLAVNELLLGMRIPEVMLIDRSSSLPISHSSYIPCPHCHTLHCSMLWSGWNGFGHWLGYVCPTCGGIIPCLQNWTSRAILLLTWPLWFLPVRWIKPRWHAYEKRRVRRKMEQPIPPPRPSKNFKPIPVGLLVGFVTWLQAEYWSYSPKHPKTLSFVLIRLFLCLVGGMVAMIIANWVLQKQMRALFRQSDEAR